MKEILRVQIYKSSLPPLIKLIEFDFLTYIIAKLVDYLKLIIYIATIK